MEETKLHTMDSTRTRAEKTFVLSLASMLNMILSIVLSMVFTRLLTKGDLAAYRQTFLAYETVAPFLALGITFGLNYILVANNGRKRGITIASLFILTMTGTIYALFIVLGGNKLLSGRFNNDIVSNLLLFMIPYAVFVTPSTIGNVVMVNQGRIRMSSTFSVFSKLLHCIVVIAIVLIFKNATAAVLGNVVASIAVAIVTIIIIFSCVLPKDEKKFNVKDMLNIIKFSLPLGLAAMIGTLDAQLDKFIVSSLLSAEEFAVYSTGAQELPFIGTITGALTTVVTVEMAVLLKDNHYEDALFLFKKVAKTTTMFLFPIALFCFIFAGEIITILYTGAYLDAVNVFRIYLLRVPASTVIFAPLLIGMGQGKKVLLRSVISLICNAVLSYFLVKNWGSSGAAIGTIIVCYLVLIPFNLFAIGKSMGKKWTKILPFKHYVIVLVALIPTAIISIILRQILVAYLNQSIIICLICAVVFILCIALTYRIVFKINVVKMAINYLKSKFKKNNVNLEEQ